MMLVYQDSVNLDIPTWDYNCRQTDKVLFRCQGGNGRLYTWGCIHLSTHPHSQEQRSGKIQLTLVWGAGRSWRWCKLSEEGNHSEPINVTKVIRFQHQCPAESYQLLYGSEMTDDKYDSNQSLESKPQLHADIYQPWCTNMQEKNLAQNRVCTKKYSTLHRPKQTY